MVSVKKAFGKTAIALALSAAASAHADLSSTVTVVSDYMFNGVSQTDNGPALQASLDYGFDSGAYIGTWASNVDFGDADDTSLEWDYYAGYYTELTDSVSLDTGLAYYTYHGDSDVGNDLDYAEAYAKFGFASGLGTTEANFWYSWDYFGLAVGHYIVQVAHTFEIAEGHNLYIGFDQSTSEDEDKWAWETDAEGNPLDDSYAHYKIAYQTSYKGFDFELSYEDTDIEDGFYADEDLADGRFVAGVSRTFGF